jgi:uncharacterized protein (DUF433 family)
LDGDGAVRVGDTQVTLDVLMTAYDRGATAEEMAQKFSEIKLADVYAVIAYCLRHEDEVRQYLAKRGGEAAKLRLEIETNPSNQMFRERLLSLKREKAASSGGG